MEIPNEYNMSNNLERVSLQTKGKNEMNCNSKNKKRKSNFKNIILAGIYNK